MIARWRHDAAPGVVPDGRRIYAIGDVHGRFDLVVRLLASIEEDQVGRPRATTEIIFLGDLIDRGPDSATLIVRLAGYRGARPLTVLRGNHEDALLGVLAGDHDAADGWIEHGGAATLASFGVRPESVDLSNTTEVIAAARAAIPPEFQRWLAGLPMTKRVGGYFFCHAGIRPGVPLARQEARDLLWIREPFLSDPSDHGMVVVHGHSIVRGGVTMFHNRIAVDTGAYRTGKLSALALERDEKWVLST